MNAVTENGRCCMAGRRYAGLFFTLCVDVNDNELGCLEAIHLFVEVLDQYFGNVCELDLVFNFHKVYASRTLLSRASAHRLAGFSSRFPSYRPSVRPPARSHGDIVV